MNRTEANAAKNSIVKLVTELGGSVENHRAQTGTQYLNISHARLNRDLVIRFADHADAYGRADYTCDGIEGTRMGAREFVLEKLNTTEKAVRRLAKARKSLARRLAERALSESGGEPYAGWLADHTKLILKDIVMYGAANA